MSAFDYTPGGLVSFYPRGQTMTAEQHKRLKALMDGAVDRVRNMRSPQWARWSNIAHRASAMYYYGRNQDGPKGRLP